LVKFLEGGLDFGDDPDDDPDPGILTEFLPLRDRGNFKNFARDQLPWRICGLWLLRLCSSKTQ